MRALLLCAAALRFLPGGVRSHGAVTVPPPRQGADGRLSPWNDTAVPWTKFEFWCPFPSAAASGKDPRNLSGSNGQACFWFSDGCSIGCEECTGRSELLVKNAAFLYNGSSASAIPSWGGEGIIPDVAQNRRAGREYGAAACHHPARATLCDKRLRTLNTNAECGAADDYFYYNPWRYPGSAPVLDACGAAGGRLPGQGGADAGRAFQNTSVARLADLGSKVLPPSRSGTVWEAGAAVEVAWTQEAWHGGGYSYRLCPASEELTEGCFARTPLRFVGNSSLRWGGAGGRRVSFDPGALGWQTSEGTLPPGSMWRKNPLPRAPSRGGTDWGWKDFGASFEPVCAEPPGCTEAAAAARAGPRDPLGACECSGQGAPTNPIGAEVVDRVLIPPQLPAGEYVLGWRWDCEQTPQVWSSCSDVTVTAART